MRGRERRGREREGERGREGEREREREREGLVKIQFRTSELYVRTIDMLDPYTCDIVSLPGNGVTSFYLVIFSWDSLGHHTCTK